MIWPLPRIQNVSVAASFSTLASNLDRMFVLSPIHRYSNMQLYSGLKSTPFSNRILINLCTLARRRHVSQSRITF